jgi:hypothetical protein
MRKKPEILHVQTLAQTCLFRVEQINLRFARSDCTEARTIAALFMVREDLTTVGRDRA